MEQSIDVGSVARSYKGKLVGASMDADVIGVGLLCVPRLETARL